MDGKNHHVASHLTLCWGVEQGQEPKRALTAADLFSAHGPLHALLLEHLRQARSALEAAQAATHPSLYPILVLLSRLRCSLGLMHLRYNSLHVE